LPLQPINNHEYIPKITLSTAIIMVILITLHTCPKNNNSNVQYINTSDLTWVTSKKSLFI